MTGAVRAPLAARVVASIGFATTIGGAVGAITLRIVDPVPVISGTFGFGDVALVGFVVMGVAFASVGALLVVRRPGNAIAWCMVLIGVGYAVGVFAAAATFSLVAIGTESALRTAQFTGWLTVLFTTLGGVLFGIGFLFPTGRGHTPRWDRWVRILLILGPVTLVMIVLQPGSLHLFPTIENPLGLGPDLRSTLGLEFAPVSAAGSVVIAPTLLWSLVSRYRLGDAIERQQLKWFALALVVAIGGVSFSVVAAFISDDPPEAGLAVFGFAGTLIPIAIGIAILRHRLYDIDRIISRTIAYAAVTGTIAVIFSALLLLLTGLMATVAGGETIAAAASTLTAFALFQPIRRRVQRTVDRRFDRSRYDADTTIRTFAGRLRNDLDISTVCGEMVDTASAVVRPVTAGVWLRERRP